MHLALYRKWRPRIFDDVIGQEHITTTLKNQIISKKTSHAYLFTGSRGTGKTTCSKILAMAVNCINSQNGEPCLECDNCKSILDGTSLDVIEMDAASNNGVDDVRTLRDEANYTPSKCLFRVYIIDEAHMLSPGAFNALLKIMEEPPAHVKFILATTEIHKVPITILSRCQRFDFIRIATQTIADRLLHIAQKEDFTLSNDAAFLIARLANGGMRDALSTLDQCTSFSNDVSVEIVSTATGIVLNDYLFKMVDYIIQNKSVDILNSIADLYKSSKDLRVFCNELIEHFRNLMIVKTTTNPIDLIHCLPDEILLLQEQSKRTSINFILRCIDVIQECSDKISKSFDKRLCLEMAMIKICTPSLDVSQEALISRIEKLENIIKNGISVNNSNQPVLNNATSNSKTKTQPETSTNEKIVPKEEPLPKKADASPKLPTSNPILFEQWAEIMAKVKEKAPHLAGFLAGSLAYIADDFLFIDCPNALLGSMIKLDNFAQILNGIMFEQTGIKYKIRVKKNKANKTPQEDIIDPLDVLAKNAKKLGVEVIEN